MKTLLKDIAFAARLLVRHRTFAALSIVALALGIGANAAIFSFVDATAIRPLPFPQPDELVFVFGTVGQADGELRTASYPEYRDWKDQSSSFQKLSAFAWAPANLRVGEQAERVVVSYVEPEYFSIFGLRPALGSILTEEQSAPPAGLPVAVISDRLWRQRFGADPGVLGRSVELDGRRLEVVGVLQKGFRGVTGDRDVWVPLRQSVDLIDGRSAEDFDRRKARWLQVVGRLAGGVGIEQAQTEMTGIARRLEDRFPDANEDRGARVISVAQDLVGDVRASSLLLFAAVGFVWLIACTNVGSLILVRMEERKREFAVRTSLGALRKRVIRQVMTETMMLSLCGGLLGLGIANWGVGLLRVLSPVDLPDYVHVGLDLRVFGFILALTVLTGGLLGLLPVLRVFKTDLTRSLKEGQERGGASTRGGRRFSGQAVLVAAEVAIAVVVLIGAALMIRSFQQQREIDPGFDPDGVLTFRLRLPGTEYSDDAVSAFARRLVPRLDSIPGVESTGLTSDMVLDAGYSAAYATTPERFEKNAEDRERIYYHRVNPDFFSTLRVPLLRGPGFSDLSGSEGHREAIVSRELAEDLWPGENPIGRTVVIIRPPGFRIVGVVGDLRYRNLVADPEQLSEDPDLYLPLLWAAPNDLSVLVKTDRRPADLLPDVRQAVADLDRNLPLFQAQPLSDLLADETSLPRLSSVLFSFFGLAALALAVLGIYGVMAYSVIQQRREIGIRMALGADAGCIRRQVLTEGLIITGTGLVVGLLFAALSVRFLRAFLYGLKTTDLPTFLGVGAILLAVGLIASYLPARRASAVSPLASIKDA